MTDGADGKVLRVAVVGLGYWGPNLVRVLHEIPGAEVVTVCDLCSGALTKVGERYPAIRLTQSFDDVVADDSVDAVIIATPVSTHFPLAEAALEAGKHVFVEKPMAYSSKEAEQLIGLADAAERIIMPGHTFLYSPPVNIIHDLIHSGELGEIHFLSSSRVNLGIHQSDVSVIWDLGPHDFSILRYWLGEIPRNVSGVSRSCVIPGIADVAFVSLEYPSGILAHVEMAWLAPSKLRRTVVVGSKKMVIYDDTSTEPVKIYDSGVMPRDPETFGEFRLTYRTGDIISPKVDAAEPLLLELEDFCRSIRTGDQPRSSSDIGLDIVRTIEKVETAIDNLSAADRD